MFDKTNNDRSIVVTQNIICIAYFLARHHVYKDISISKEY